MSDHRPTETMPEQARLCRHGDEAWNVTHNSHEEHRLCCNLRIAEAEIAALRATVEGEVVVAEENQDLRRLLWAMVDAVGGEVRIPHRTLMAVDVSDRMEFYDDDSAKEAVYRRVLRPAPEEGK